MNHLVEQIRDEVRGAWRFRWWGILAAWTVCLLGWLLVIALPNTYEAAARVYVDTKSILRPLLQGLTIAPDVSSELDIVRQALLSRPHLEKVARVAELDLRARTPQARDELIASLQKRIVIESAGSKPTSAAGEGLYRISFKDSSRPNSLAVVKTLLNSFVEDTLGSKRSSQETAQRFLDVQISDHEARLTAAEASLSEFKKKNLGSMPDQRGDYFGRLQTEQAALDQARNSLGLAESRQAEVSRQLSGEEPFIFGFDAGANTTSSDSGRSGDLTFRIQDLEKKLDELLLRYTEKHPEVIATRKTIEELRARQAEELTRLKAGRQATGSLSSSLKSNPVYQGLQLELKRTEVQVAELRQDVAQRQAKVSDLRRLVNSVPEVEAELARLNRDYEVTRGQYLELVKRRETANLSEDADRTGTVKFDVIDPPAVGAEPVAPNRPMLLTAVLVAALAAALGIPYVLNQIKPVFQTVRALTEIAGLPVLAAVSRTWGERHRAARRIDVLKLSGAAAALFLVFGAVLILQDLGVRVMQRIIG
jgi:polysaccharide chain length determinant protein (PEP-CTERM system associated)